MSGIGIHGVDEFVIRAKLDAVTVQAGAQASCSAIRVGRSQDTIGADFGYVQLGGVYSREISEDCPRSVRRNRDASWIRASSHRVACGDFLADQGNVAGTNGVGTDRAVP